MCLDNIFAVLLFSLLQDE